MRLSRRLAPRAARRLLVPLAGVLLLAPLPAMSAAPKAGWSTVPLAAGAFSAAFPVERPTAKSYVRPGGTLRVWFAETRTGLFIAAEAPRSAAASATAERVVQSLDGKLVAVKAVAFPGGSRAVRYWFSLRAGRGGEGVLVPVGRRVYTLLALTGPKQGAAASRFVASLAIPASAKAAEPLPDERRSEAPPALSAEASGVGEHLASALAVHPAVLAATKDVTVSAAPVSRPQQTAVVDTSDQDGIPDPHADVSGQHSRGISTQEEDFGTAIAPVPDPRSSSGAMLDDVAPRPPAEAQPSPRTAFPAELRTSPAANPPPPPAASFAPPPHWIWLPSAWRWNGYSWEWLPGHWARAAE